VITDLSVGYRFGSRSVTLSADNILDVMPDRNIDLNTVGGTKPYSEYAPYGQNGRFMCVRLSYAP